MGSDGVGTGLIVIDNSYRSIMPVCGGDVAGKPGITGDQIGIDEKSDISYVLATTFTRIPCSDQDY